VRPPVEIFTAALDRQLDPRRYILPGLGDFGDRLYGT
jgi:uracil phosphoribosyltransferase